ncbi:MAG: ABC transporter permease [Planctomycetes bacterium]|nr:ABC transporter permease [Planctomycetota bacterium]
MNKGCLVALREYHENLRTKTFWIGIFFFPLVLVLSIAVPRFLESQKEVRRFAVVDRSGWLAQRVLEDADLPDLEAVLRDLRGRAAAGEDDPAWPEQIRTLAGELGKVPEDQLRGIAESLARAQEALTLHPEALASLPPAQREQIEHELESFQAWWRGLSAEDARGLESVDLARQKYDYVHAPEAQDETAWAEQALARGEIFAWFEIDGDPVTGEGRFLYHSRNLTDGNLRNWFQKHVNDVVQSRRFETEKIREDVVRKIQKPLVFTETITDETGQAREAGSRDKASQFLPMAFVYLLWISVFMVAQMLLTNTIEEKSNRTIEVLLSSVSPLQLMSGKIGGIAATGLTVVLSWLVFFFLVVKVGLPLFGIAPPFDLAPLLANPRYILGFVVYFLLGYLLYAGILVGLGSVCNSLKEAQNLMMPVSVMLMLPLFAMFPVVNDPNSTLARVLSYVPTLTPFVMMNRAAGPPPLMDYVCTTIILLVTILLVFWAAAKIFRIGILMTGKPPRLGEILRWLRAPIGVIPDRSDD